MKPIRFAPLVATALFCITGCDKSTDRLSDLERKASDALARQQELEQQLEDQRIAAERDAIERERLQIEEARAALELQQQENNAAEAEALRQREEELARREGRIEQAEISLQDQSANHASLAADLSQRERELAGREALIAEEVDDYPTGPVADYGMFYDSLSSYGSWFETPDYGYVWQPVIVRDVSWRPYTRGRWACTDRGWTWMSDEPFGWATYHYGRWALLRGHGWVWVPGSEWAPSWVSWRSSGTCIGWAPLPPETLAWRSHQWGNTVDVTFSIGSLWFSFVEYRHFGEPIHRHCLPYRLNHDYYRQTINITNIHVYNQRVICGGPRYEDIRRRGCESIPYYRLDMDRQTRPGRDSLAMRPRVEDGRLRISAPNIDADWNSELRPTKLKGRLQTVSVERPEPLKPEIIENFRKSREKERTRAERLVAESGGREAFNRSRLETLEANRRQFSSLDRGKGKNRDNKSMPSSQGNPQPPAVEITDREKTTRNNPEQPLAQTGTSRFEDSRRHLQKPGKPRIETPSRKDEPTTRVEPQQAPAEPLANQEMQREKALKERIEIARAQQQSQKKQPASASRGLDQRQPVEKTRGGEDQARQMQIEQATREQQRQQEQQLQRQRDDSRRQQLENARQQEKAMKRQAEQERQQQQLEQARQKQIEQARQQQQEQALQQQRKQQLEQARQQQEQARREQQRQMEEARQKQQQEQARQQQRQLEQQRQQQHEQARQQQHEQARQQQQEQARQQQRQLEQQRQQQQQQQFRERQQSESKKDDDDRGLRRR